MHGGYCCFLGQLCGEAWFTKCSLECFYSEISTKFHQGALSRLKKRKCFLPNFFTLSRPLHNNRLRESKFSLKYKTGLLLRDIACTQTLFYFSFRCLRKDRRARDRSKRARARASAERENEKVIVSSSPTPTPLRWSINPPRICFLSRPLNGLWRENRVPERLSVTRS